MGVAALHLHSTHSDGRCTVGRVLDLLAVDGQTDLVAFTDHDEIGAWEEAVAWKERHPDARLTPLWGCEVTVRGFKHVLAYIFQPPYPARRFPAMRPFEETAQRIADAGGVCIVAHPDQWVVGLGLARLDAALQRVPVLGVETHSPYVRSQRRLIAFARERNLAAVGASDAHFEQHLLKWTTRFPGATPEDLRLALERRATEPAKGTRAADVPASELALQQLQALLIHPSRKLARLVRGGR